MHTEPRSGSRIRRATGGLAVAAWLFLLVGAPEIARAATIVGGDLGGADLLPNDGDVLSGTFTNVGLFHVAAGATVFVEPGTPLFVTAQEIRVEGTLDGVGAGEAGGDVAPANPVSAADGLPGSGPGGGSGGDLGDGYYSNGGGGGAYGGGGGSSSSLLTLSPAPTPGGTAYGSAASLGVLMGSGGGSGGNHFRVANGGHGGAGGGAITLHASTVTISGAVVADGEDGFTGSDASAPGGGGGSGGGVQICALVGTVSGFVSAAGGDGAVGTRGFTQAGGGGAGGRIKVSATVVVSGGVLVPGGASPFAPATFAGGFQGTPGAPGSVELALAGCPDFAPLVANGFLSPTLVRAPLGGAPGTLSVAATLGLGDKSVDFSDPTSITFGSTMLDLPDGLTPNRRGSAWTWISEDRLTRVSIVPPNRRNGTSRGRFSLVVRGWSDMLPPYPGGVGEALDIGLACGAFSVGCNVQLVAGGVQHRLNTQLADAPALTLDRVAGFLHGAHTPRVAVTASFAGDGVIPGAPPTVTLSLGEPGSTYDVTVPTMEHVTTPTPTGWQFAIPDPDGTGPLLPEGTWFVDVDYVHRRVSVFVRDEDFGTFPRGTVPFLFSLDLGGGAQAVQVCASQRSNRLSYR